MPPPSVNKVPKSTAHNPAFYAGGYGGTPLPGGLEEGTPVIEMWGCDRFGRFMYPAHGVGMVFNRPENPTLVTDSMV